MRYCFIRWEGRSRRPGGVPTDYRYTGQRQEEGLGLYRMGARWYDPALARWLSADTLVPGAWEPQALNRYSYVLGNPMRYIDPSGHKETACSHDSAQEECLDDELYESYQWYCSENPGSEYCQPSMTYAEVAFWFVVSVNGAEVVVGVVEAGGAYVIETVSAKALAKAALNGAINTGGYVAGSVVTGEEIDLVDAGLAFVAGAITPGGSGTGWKKVATAVGWGIASNGTQSAVSQGIDWVTGEQNDFSLKELAVNAAVGGVGTALGDLATQPVESYVQNAVRGLARGASGAVQIAFDTAFSWVRSWFDQ